MLLEKVMALSAVKPAEQILPARLFTAGELGTKDRQRFSGRL